MTWQWSNLFFPLVIGALSVFVAAVTIWTRKVRGHRLGAMLLVSAGIWLLSASFEVLGADLETKLFWTKIQYFGISSAPSLWLLLSFRFSGRDHWVSPFSALALFLIPIITLAFALTNDVHNLVWVDAWIPEGSYFAVKSLNIWFYIFLSHAYLAIVFGVLLITITLVQTRRLFRWQAIIFMGAVLAPIMTNMLVDNFKQELGLTIELTPFVLVISVPLIAWGLFRLRALDIIQIARQSAIESMRDAVVILDVRNRITDLNPAAVDIIGIPKADIIWRSIQIVNPEIMKLITGEDMVRETEVKLQVNDAWRTYNLVKSPVTNTHDEVISQVVVFHDITKRVAAEAQVKESLFEKEILLKEVHHRVKNNLQVVISLLNLQSRQTPDLNPSSLRESQSRIQAMAFVHEQLYRYEKLSKIDFDRYVHELVAYLIEMYQAKQRKILFDQKIDPFDLVVDQAIPCGLVINEIVSNSLKHAFPEGRAGKIRIRMWLGQGNTVCLQIDDDGVGLPEDFDFQQVSSLGLQLVNRLTQQLGGDFSIHSEGGTIVECSFPCQV